MRGLPNKTHYLIMSCILSYRIECNFLHEKLNCSFLYDIFSLWVFPQECVSIKNKLIIDFCTWSQAWYMLFLDMCSLAKNKISSSLSLFFWSDYSPGKLSRCAVLKIVMNIFARLSKCCEVETGEWEPLLFFFRDMWHCLRIANILFFLWQVTYCVSIVSYSSATSFHCLRTCSCLSIIPVSSVFNECKMICVARVMMMMMKMMKKSDGFYRK